MNKECGMCGEKDFDKLIGPFASGPYPYYCKRCRLIIDDFQDMIVVPRNPERQQLLMKWIKAKDEHTAWIKTLSGKETK